MGDVIRFGRRTRPNTGGARLDRRLQRVAVQRATRFRVEIPVTLHELRSDPVTWGEAMWHYVCDFAESKGAADLIGDLCVVFVGGLDAARAADQAWFTDYLSPGMILVCYEARA